MEKIKWNDGDPSWSTDGKWIAFPSSRFGNHDIFLMSFDCDNQMRVTGGPAWE